MEGKGEQHCNAVAMETMGAFGPRSLAFVRDLGHLVAMECREPRATDYLFHQWQSSEVIVQQLFFLLVFFFFGGGGVELLTSSDKRSYHCDAHPLNCDQNILWFGCLDN